MRILRPTAIPGCFELQLPRHDDHRGTLVKTFQHSVFRSLGLRTDFVEQFHSRSRAGVVRGLHLQRPPSALAKIVTAVSGVAWDVVLDVRAGSPTFGAHDVIGLSARRANAVFIPEGCAHGFLAQEDDTVLAYWVTAEHDRAADDGIRWDSAGIDWPLDAPPVLSTRDLALPPFDQYRTPFRFEG